MLVLCFKAELSKSLFPFLAIAKQLLEAGLCVQKRFMYSDVSSLLSQLPTALHALVFKVGLWALGHQLSAVLLCWQHGPCWEMWSVSALRPELGALREHTVQSPVVPPRSWSTRIGRSNRHMIPHCVSTVTYHRLVYPILAQASIVTCKFVVS